MEGSDPPEDQQRQQGEIPQSAREFHREIRQGIHKSNLMVVEAGNIAVKSLFLINGGAVVAILAFIANAWQSFNPEAAAHLAGALQQFAIGVAGATAASCMAYFTNYLYVSSVSKWAKTTTYPYAEDTASSKSTRKVGMATHFLAVVAAAISFIMFCLGVLQTNEALAAMFGFDGNSLLPVNPEE